MVLNKHLTSEEMNEESKRHPKQRRKFPMKAKVTSKSERKPGTAKPMQFVFF